MVSITARCQISVISTKTNLSDVAVKPPQLKHDLLLLVNLGEVELVVVEGLLEVEHGLRGPPLGGTTRVVLQDEAVAALQHAGLGRRIEIVLEVPEFHVLFPRRLQLPVELSQLDGVGHPGNGWNLKPIRPPIIGCNGSSVTLNSYKYGSYPRNIRTNYLILPEV